MLVPDIRGSFSMVFTRSSQRNYEVVVLSQGTRLILPPSLSGIFQLIPASCERGERMNTLFQVDEPSIAKRVAVVIAGVVLLGVGVWAGIVMALRLASGR